MITLYHLDQSRSERIIWLLEELGLDYQLEVFLRQPDLYAPVALLEAHVLGRAPVIRDGEVLLAKSPYLAGPAFTAADIMMAYPFITFRRICPVDLSPYPAIKDYVARLEARPAFQKATHRFATHA